MQQQQMDGSMLSQAILSVSALLQLTAVAMSIRLIRVTRHPVIWILMSSALSLQAARRILSLVAVASGHANADPLYDAIGLIVSVGMLAVVWLIKTNLETLAKSEERFRTVADFTYDMEIWEDPKGTCLYVSPSCERITGHPPEAFMANQNFFKHLVHPEDLPLWQAHRMDVWEGAGQSLPSDEISFRILRPDGEVRWIGHVCRFVQDAKGHPMGRRISNRDITERKLMELENAALEAENQQLKKSESLGRMAGAVAHHFNNQLQAVMSNLELIGERPKDVDLSQYLTRAKQAIERAAEVSRQLLVYLGQTSREREPRFLSELCRGSLPIVQITLPETLAIEEDFPSPGPIICANTKQIQQVLTNLITNAWEAIDDTRGSIRLSLNTRPATDISIRHRFPIGWRPKWPDYACLEVADTGSGIAEADIEKLFDPFFSTKTSGRGLGLSSVLGIVRAHDGAITVESDHGQGSVFRIYFPVATEAVPDVPEKKIRDGITVLLVDDDEFLLLSTGALIKTMGLRLLTAKDGVEAVEVFRQHKDEISCVITDLTMPNMNGWETLTALRQLEPGLPVILASGYDKGQVMSGAHPDLPDAFLEKPYSLKQLRDAVGQILIDQYAGKKDQR